MLLRTLAQAPTKGSHSTLVSAFDLSFLPSFFFSFFSFGTFFLGSSSSSGTSLHSSGCRFQHGQSGKQICARGIGRQVIGLGRQAVRARDRDNGRCT